MINQTQNKENYIDKSKLRDSGREKILVKSSPPQTSIKLVKFVQTTISGLRKLIKRKKKQIDKHLLKAAIKSGKRDCGLIACLLAWPLLAPWMLSFDQGSLGHENQYV